jgi:hypothetical protein
MTRRARRHAHFEADFVRLLDSIVTRGDEAWIEHLLSGVIEASGLVEQVPGVGTLMATSGTIVMRKLILPKGPYVAWYLYDAADRDGDVWLVRLFHARQRRPQATPGRWLQSLRKRRR